MTSVEICQLIIWTFPTSFGLLAIGLKVLYNDWYQKEE